MPNYSGGGVRVGEHAPTSVGELFDRYYALIARHVRACGIDPQDAEDIASEIIARFAACDWLPRYDPALGPFRTFLLRGFVEPICRTWRDRQHRRHARECLAGDLVDMAWLGAPMPDPSDEVTDLLDMQRWTTQLLNRLMDEDQWRAVSVLDTVVTDGSEMGCVSVTALAYQLGVSQTTAYAWWWRTRALVAEHLGRELPAKRPHRRRPDPATG